MFEKKVYKRPLIVKVRRCFLCSLPFHIQFGFTIAMKKFNVVANGWVQNLLIN